MRTDVSVDAKLQQKYLIQNLSHTHAFILLNSAEIYINVKYATELLPNPPTAVVIDEYTFGITLYNLKLI